jgi:hypothetical protein
MSSTWRYHESEDYPVTAWRIEQVHAEYPGTTYIEDNEAGAAVRSFLKIPRAGRSATAPRASRSP